jgi:hypothetical protein
VEITCVDENKLADFPAVREFRRIAQTVPNAIFTQFGLVGLPDDVAVSGKKALALVRVLIQGSKRLHEGRKFIVTVRFQGYGDSVLIDLVSLNLDLHREIALAHLVLWGNEIPSQFDVWAAFPYVVAGGHVCREDEIARFDGSHGDFGNLLFGVEVNHVASYLLGHTDIGTDAVQSDAGQRLMQDILGLMLKFQRSAKFYERAYDFLLAKMPGNMYGQHIAALIAMKAHDRVAAEGGDLKQRFDEETAGRKSLALYMMTTRALHQYQSRQSADASV